MNRKYSIGIFVGAVMIFGILLTVLYQTSYNHAKIQLAKAEEEKLNKEEQKLSDQSVRTEGTAQKEDIYYLKEKNGFVVVYLSDGTSVYEYTNIAVDSLPEDVKNEIHSGKKIESTQELYGFLENYSS